MKKYLFMFVYLLGFSASSQAALVDYGNGLIGDNAALTNSPLGRTWLKDGNIFKTLCDAGDVIATGFTPVDAVDATAICGLDGKMSWDDAVAWIARLNANDYLGFDDWRLPNTLVPDSSCSSGNSSDYCLGGEFEQWFHTELSNPNVINPINGTCDFSLPNNCFENVGPFVNFRINPYWSIEKTTAGKAWFFEPSVGVRDSTNKTAPYFVWPVRSGFLPVSCDLTGDGDTDILDAVALINVFLEIYEGGGDPNDAPPEADCNGDGNLDMDDIYYIWPLILEVFGEDGEGGGETQEMLPSSGQFRK